MTDKALDVMAALVLEDGRRDAAILEPTGPRFRYSIEADALRFLVVLPTVIHLPRSPLPRGVSLEPNQGGTAPLALPVLRPALAPHPAADAHVGHLGSALRAGARVAHPTRVPT